MTYSIIAVDKETGAIGVAVQSHYFAVAHCTPYAKAGVGAVAAQAYTNRRHGEYGLQLLSEGMLPEEVLSKLIKEDSDRDIRQTAIIDSKGNTAVYTGKKCIKFAEHKNSSFYSIQANLMKTDLVISSMEKAFMESKSSFVFSLLETLEAAEKAGGDLRGMQSASIKVVKGESSGSDIEDVLIDFHIYDHDNPLLELRRNLKINEAYKDATRSIQLLKEDKIEDAISLHQKLKLLEYKNVEFDFWFAVELANSGNKKESIEMLKAVIKNSSNWEELAFRLIDSNQLNLSREELIVSS